MGFIPYPSKISDISKIYEHEKKEHVIYYIADNRHFLSSSFSNIIYPGILEPVKTGQIQNNEYPICNAYSFFRGIIQSNEACNKIIGTVELLHALCNIREKPNQSLCKSFNVEFSGGTIVPTLYYAEISAITSLFSLFGCILHRDEFGKKSYNIVRTNRGWMVYHRKHYVKSISREQGAHNWHSQIITMLKIFNEKLEDFPSLTIGMIELLYEARNKAHYSVLGSVSARTSRGLDDYFHYLPLVMNSINEALKIINDVWGGHHYLAGFNRFKELHSKIDQLYIEYDRTPTISIEPIKFK